MLSVVPAGTSVGVPSSAILGIPFDHVTADQALERIEQMIALRRPHYVVTPNVDFLVQARDDVELRRILLEAHLVLCDGTPVLWASRLLGNPLPARVAGSDIAPRLIQVAAAKGYRLFLLGAQPDSARKAVDQLRRQHPELIICGQYSPPVHKLLEMDHVEIRRRIRQAAPDILLVAFGCPKQEKWIAMHYRSLGVPVSIGCGATIDFLGGQIRRAPGWMRRAGLEWVFRMLQEPRRLAGRYARDLRIFGCQFLAHWWRLQALRPRAAAAQTSGWGCDDAFWFWYTPPVHLDRNAVWNDEALIHFAAATGRHCLVQLAHVQFMDGAGLGFLIRLQKEVRGAGRQLVLLSPSAAVRRALKLMRLEDQFICESHFTAARRAVESRDQEQVAAVTVAAGVGTGQVLWRGEITAANAGAVWHFTRTQIASARQGELVIDLSGLRFIDSSGLGVVLRASQYAREMSVTLEFAHAPAHFKSLVSAITLQAGSYGDSRRRGSESAPV